MIGQDLRYKKRFVPLAHVLARPYGIPFPGAKNARRSRSRGRAGGFCSWPRPELRTKRIRAPFFFPGRISPKGPASMRDASDLHLILYRCPRFTSGAPGPSTYRSFCYYVPSTRRLLSEHTCLRFSFFLSSLFAPFHRVRSHPPPRRDTRRSHVCHSVTILCHRFAFCCDGRERVAGIFRIQPRENLSSMPIIVGSNNLAVVVIYAET